MSLRLNARRFDAIELLLAMAFAAFGAFIIVSAWPTRHPEAAALARSYGPQTNSENEEEWIIRDFFQDRTGGVFVDVGAGHHQVNSNTYFLEKNLGWSGVAIEPMAHFAAGYLEHRPNTKFQPYFASDSSGVDVKMYTFDRDFLATSSDKEFVERFGKNPSEFTAQTATINDLLAAANLRSVDFLSMDIELSEPKALAGFDIQRFRPQLVCIEAHPEVRQQILDYFATNGYVLVGKYLRADSKNLYFRPLA